MHRRVPADPRAKHPYPRVIAQRARPVGRVRHIEAYTGLSARDAIPCQCAQLPAFMERLADRRKELRWDSNLWDAVTSGFMGSDEDLEGSFGDHKFCTETWTLFPRKLQQQYDNMRSSFGYASYDDACGCRGLHCKASGARVDAGGR